jgi:hypothetical protein
VVEGWDGACGCAGWVCALDAGLGGGRRADLGDRDDGAVDAGKEIEETGVPAGTSTVTVTVWPVASVSWNVRSSAFAGSTAAPKPAVAMPAVASATVSLRVFIPAVPLPAPSRPKLPWKWLDGRAR